MKQTAAIILLGILLLMQYNRQLSYYYCLLKAVPEASSCVCAEDVTDNNVSPALPVPPQKAGKIFFTEEAFISAGNYTALGLIKFLYNSYFNQYRHNNYNYCYYSRVLKPPQRIA